MLITLNNEIVLMQENVTLPQLTFLAECTDMPRFTIMTILL
jgi:hypothetical protein